MNWRGGFLGGLSIFFSVLFFLSCRLSFASRDDISGQITRAAERALEIGDVRPALVWVGQEDEDEVREAFAEVGTVRKLGIPARQLADRYFIETLLRLYLRRLGLAYTGMEDIQEPGQVFLAANEALEKGSVNALAAEVSELVEQGVRARFDKALIKKKHMDNSVEAGREYVDAYVDYIRYLEQIHLAASGVQKEPAADK